MDTTQTFSSAEAKGIDLVNKKLQPKFDKFERSSNPFSSYDFRAKKGNTVYLIETKHRKEKYYDDYQDMLLERKKLAKLIKLRNFYLSKGIYDDVKLVYCHTYGSKDKVRITYLIPKLNYYGFEDRTLQKNHVVNNGFTGKSVTFLNNFKVI